MRFDSALASGLAGAAALSLVHESARHLIPHAPRVDVIGERALARSLRAVDRPVPGPTGLYLSTLAGDLVSNAAYYALVGLAGRRRAFAAGTLLGVAAGLGAALLPERIGLGEQPGAKPPLTQALTVAWYTLGGMVAGALYRRSA